MRGEARSSAVKGGQGDKASKMRRRGVFGVSSE